MSSESNADLTSSTDYSALCDFTVQSLGQRLDDVDCHLGLYDAAGNIHMSPDDGFS
jgi:hypothetical protein